MTVREEIQPGQLADLLKQVEAGNEVVLTRGQKPVARLVAAGAAGEVARGPLTIGSLGGHKVLTPGFTSAEIADEMFGQK